MNTVSLIGRLTADPQSRAGENHESAYFRMAVVEFPRFSGHLR